MSPETLYLSYGKRVFDLAAASAAILLFSPLMVLIGILVYMKLGRPVFFRQKRPGLGGVPFRIAKFRTMAPEEDLTTDPDGEEPPGRENRPERRPESRPDSERLDSFGAFLRSTSLDELPELFNVIRGDMSIVGPRPLLMEYLPLYNPRQAGRHRAKPGITGWAQVNGRNAITWEEKFELDNWYVDNVSFALDMKIVLMTLKKVLAREAVNHEGEATMPRFRGTPQ